MSFDPKEFLTRLFHTAVAAVDPEKVLPGFLDEALKDFPVKKGLGNVVVIGAGKAAAAMAAALENNWEGNHLREGVLRGVVVTAYGHAVPCKQIEVIEAAHPVPDENSEIAAQRILNLVSDLNKNDLVICLLSGGGSSLLAMPALGITLEDKQQINQALLKSGADIHEINCVRKHLSGIKGGRLAMACAPAKLVTFAISDVTGNVPGDDPAVIASGPTVADPTTRQQALAILNKYHIAMNNDVVHQWLSGSESETPKVVSEHSEFQVIATAKQSLKTAAAQVEQMGLKALMLGDDLTGESSELAKAHAELARSILLQGQPVSAPCVILSGGETTVQVTGNGRGGRNTEYLLNLVNQLKGQQGVYALAADTDGIDGSGDNAGAILSPDSWQRAEQLNLNIIESLENNDSYTYFDALGDLVVTGPTHTNVNDFRAIFLWPENEP
jgi:glycerate 2-kinase